MKHFPDLLAMLACCARLDPNTCLNYNLVLFGEKGLLISAASITTSQRILVPLLACVLKEQKVFLCLVGNGRISREDCTGFLLKYLFL